MRLDLNSLPLFAEFGVNKFQSLVYSFVYNTSSVSVQLDSDNRADLLTVSDAILVGGQTGLKLDRT